MIAVSSLSMLRDVQAACMKRGKHETLYFIFMKFTPRQQTAFHAFLSATDGGDDDDDDVILLS